MLWQNIDPYQHLQYYLSYYVFITGAMTSIYVCNPVILNTILCCLQLSAMSIMKRRTYNVSFISKVLKDEQPIDGVTLDIFYVLKIAMFLFHKPKPALSYISDQVINESLSIYGISETLNYSKYDSTA